MKVKVEVSARHIHLSSKDMETLFGKGYNCSKLKDLSQPGQFACNERVSIQSAKGKIDGVIILGPCRAQTQVEISITDCIKLGIKPVVRESGNLSGSPGCVIVGPKASINISEGTIVAHRHIHMNLDDAKSLGIKDGHKGRVAIKSNFRSLIFEDVIIRVNEKFSLSMHIDTDEANAVGFEPGMVGELFI